MLITKLTLIRTARTRGLEPMCHGIASMSLRGSADIARLIQNSHTHTYLFYSHSISGTALSPVTHIHTRILMIRLPQIQILNLYTLIHITKCACRRFFTLILILQHASQPKANDRAHRFLRQNFTHVIFLFRGAQGDHFVTLQMGIGVFCAWVYPRNPVTRLSKFLTFPVLKISDD